MTTCGGEDGSDLDQRAEALLAGLVRPTPRRRARPRLAEPLHEAEDRLIDTPAGPVMAWRLGAGPAILLVHGWEDDNALWGPLIDRLQANGRPVVALDLPGHGYSPAEMDARDAAGAAVKAVAEAFGPIEAVVGHSFGCVAVVAALDAGMAAESAVLIASPIPKNRVRPLERIREAEAPSAVIDRAVALYTDRQAALAPFDIEAAAARMTTQALIIHSLDDENTQPENSRLIADAWTGSELMWVDGLGHRLVAQNGDVLQRVADFVEGFG
jgi:pimeloyl-ACP methyl ester carboxylesterase